MNAIDNPALYREPSEPIADAYTSLRPAEKAFVDAYLANLGSSASAAGQTLWDAVRRGARPSDVSARGAAMLQLPRVQAAISERAKALCDKFELDQNRVLKEVANIAFSNMAHYLHLTPDGDPYISLANCTYEQLAAISEVTVEDFTEGRGDDSRNVRRIKLKLHKKLEGLEKVIKLLQMYAPERVEHTHHVAVSEFDATMTPEQLADEWAKRLKVVS